MRHILFVLAFAACSNQATTKTTTPAAETKPEAKDEVKAASNTFGKPFDKKDVVAISAVAKDATPFLNKTIQLEGKVSAVCQNKGCWMEMTDADTKTKVRIFVDKSTSGYSFTVPKDCSGKTATVEGTLVSKEVSQEEAAHIASESNQPAPTGPVQELQLTATGVLLADS
jgi:lipoprotein-anchoring transpeptidase ErfK/SrfK